MFDPKSRNLPKAGNTEAAEQLWAKAVAQVPSLKCMSRGRFRFTLLSAFALWNSWAEKVPFGERSSRTFKARRKFDKHKKRSKENKVPAPLDKILDLDHYYDCIAPSIITGVHP